MPFLRPKFENESVLSAIDKAGYNHSDFYHFYYNNGNIQIELLDALILEAIKRPGFSKLEDVEKAYIGLEMLNLLQKRVVMEKDDLNINPKKSKKKK